MKTTWTRPTLIELVQGKPEERVLDCCKSYDQYGRDREIVGCYADWMCQPGACEVMLCS